MANKTQTIAKAATKATTKAAPKAAPKPKVAPKAKAAPAAPVVAQIATTPALKAPATTAPSVVALIVTGVTDRLAKGSAFYSRALSYHKEKGTVFPRERNDARRTALTPEKVAEVFRLHDNRTLAAGNGDGQAVFDAYMMHRTT